MKFEDFLRTALSCKSVRPTGRGGGGCISRGQGFLIDEKDSVFVKENGQAKVWNLTFSFANEYNRFMEIMHLRFDVSLGSQNFVVLLSFCFNYANDLNLPIFV